MIGLDTNILVRYFLQDDPVQSGKVNDFLAQDKEFFINNLVICELILILEQGYSYERKEIIGLLNKVFTTKGFFFENITSLWLALEKFEKENVDFADALISYINIDAGCQKTLTFHQEVA